MNALARLADVIDDINEAVGWIVSWLTLGCVLVCFAVVVLRYVFNTGSILLQELYVWFHGIIFMAGAGYTLRHRGHVRVDILYGRLAPRRRAWINIFGVLVFLFPWLIVVAVMGAPFILSSWAIQEGSAQPGGMPAVFLLKSVIWLFCALLGLQGLALLCRNVLFLAGRTPAAPAGAAD